MKHKRSKYLVAVFILLVVIGSSGCGDKEATPQSELTESTLSPTMIPAGSSNSAWTPVEQDFNAISFVYVPAGCFFMGTTDEQADADLDLCKQYLPHCDRIYFEDEKPAHKVCVGDFWIMQTEVTRAMYEACVAAGECSAAPKSYMYSERDTQPINRVTWFQAQDYCASIGGRLPTEAEWEYAARGPESFVFPWGNDFVGKNAVWADTSGDRTADVGSRPEGASWVGALDMSGNVREWVSSIYLEYPYQVDDGRENNDDTNSSRVVRGGSFFLSYPAFVRASYRSDFVPEVENNTIGIRCARSYQP